MVKQAETSVEIQLLKAVAYGTVVDVAALFAQQPDLDPNLLYRGSETILSRAMLCGPYRHEQGLAIVRFLLERGADPNYLDEKGYNNPVYQALNGSPDFLEALLQHPDVKPDVPRRRGGSGGILAETPLSCIASQNASHIIDHNDKEAVEKRRASQHRNFIKFELLYNHPRTDKTICGRDGENLLLAAIGAGNTQIVQFLLDRGWDINTRSSTGKGAPHYAVENGDSALLELLMARSDLNVNVADEDGVTALELAARYAGKGKNGGYPQEHYWNAVEYLLTHPGVDPSIVNTKFRTALQRASRAGRAPIVQLLLNKGADPNQAYSDPDDRSFDRQLPPVTLTVVGMYWVRMMPPANARRYEGAEHGKALKLLLAAGADINQRDARNRNILHWAIHVSSSLVAELLDKGADPNVMSEALSGRIGSGETPLMSAIEAYRLHPMRMVLALLTNPRTDLNLLNPPYRNILQFIDQVKEWTYKGKYAFFDQQSLERGVQKLDRIRERAVEEVLKRAQLEYFRSGKLSIKPVSGDEKSFWIIQSKGAADAAVAPKRRISPRCSMLSDFTCLLKEQYGEGIIVGSTRNGRVSVACKDNAARHFCNRLIAMTAKAPSVIDVVKER